MELITIVINNITFKVLIMYSGIAVTIVVTMVVTMVFCIILVTIGFGIYCWKKRITKKT